ncbi:MAG: DEAD/DEAH box helicase [Alicyclobacillus sp.]|nr:DEAD/DEAH box helicase [Alicyclobacillus sp.]
MLVDLSYQPQSTIEKAQSAVGTGPVSLRVTFKYDERLVQEMRAMQGAHWDSLDKAWYVPFRQEFLQRLYDLGAVFSLRTLDAVKMVFPKEFSAALLQDVRRAVAHSTGLPLPPIEGLHRDLLPFQRAGIAAIQANGGRVLLADEMGLGKTIQAIGFCHVNRFEKILVVCPRSALYNWKYEIEATLGEQRICIVRGTKSASLPDTRWYLINYDILAAHVDELKSLNVPCVIIDEAHYIKNKGAQRTKACLEVALNSPYVLALTGTPILNRAIEFWTVLNLLDPETFSDRKTFVQNYCPSATARNEWDDDRQFRTSKNLDALRELLERTVLIRRTKAEVLPQLPPKRRSAVLLDIDNREEYEATEQELLKRLEESNLSISEVLWQHMSPGPVQKNSLLLALIELARDHALKGKYKQCLQWIKDFLDTTDQKLVVFGHHRWLIKALKRDLEDYGCVTLYGEDSGVERELAKQRFNTDPNTRVIVLGIEVGSESHTLTAASHVAFIELPWQPAKATQAEDRVHRIGQTADSVHIYHLLAVNTIEEAIGNLLRKKQKVISEILPLSTRTHAGIEEIQDRLNHYLLEIGLRVVRDDEWVKRVG